MTNWDDKDEVFDLLVTHYNSAIQSYMKVMEYEGYAYTEYLAGDALAAIYNILWCINYLRMGLYDLIATDSNPSDNSVILYYINTFAGVSWQSIVQAWVANDFEARFWTIGVIDRMRQILWDEPFDLTWAARPEDKPVV